MVVPRHLVIDIHQAALRVTFEEVAQLIIEHGKHVAELGDFIVLEFDVGNGEALGP
jgi:hypothetical protein